MSARATGGRVGLAFGTWLLGCGSPPPVEPAPEPAPAPTPEPPAPPPEPARASPAERLVVLHPRELAELPLQKLVALDLALSLEDRRARSELLRDDLAYDTACAELDLTRLAEQAPALQELRLSGCQEAVHAGLAALAGVRTLELVDLTLDAVTMGRIASLPRLESLTLTRVKAGSDPMTLLARAKPTALTLRELDTDSPIAAVIGHMPGLRTLTLEGAWAGHDAMLPVARATGLQEVRLLDTRAGNFSLHQLKPLTGLTRLEWRGSTFNDYSPLYVRDLPIAEFTCACPGLGDGGLKVLGRQPGLRKLVLPQSRITGAGLESLVKVGGLRELEIRRRDIGPEGLAALAKLPELRALVLGLQAPPVDPALTHLGELAALQTLVLDIPALDDRVADELAALTELRELDLGGTQLSDAGLRALANMRALRVLKLHHTKITNRGLANLAGLAQLEELELDHTDVVDAGVAHLAGLSALRVLRLDATLITDAALQHLRELDKLERLNVADTVITAEGVAGLRHLPALRAVNLARTRAEGP